MQYRLSTTTIPTSFLLPSQWPQSHNQELLLAMEESAFTEKIVNQEFTNEVKLAWCEQRKPIALMQMARDENISFDIRIRTLAHQIKLNEIRRINSNLIVIGKTTADNEKEKFKNGTDADEEDVDIEEESDGQEFGRGTG